MAAFTVTQGVRKTITLIGSDKVEGTHVYRSNGEKIGTVEHLMIDRLSGKVAYAVMSFGGFLGIGHDHYPIPWSLLKYNPRLEGYEVNITERQLKGAPKYSRDDNWDWTDHERSRKVYDYYKVPFYFSGGPTSRATPSALEGLVRRGYSEEEIFALVVPKRTLARRRSADELLTVEETDKALRLERIALQAERVFGDPAKAYRWLRKPKRELSGETPLAYLASEAGARAVEEMLYRIEYGLFA